MSHLLPEKVALHFIQNFQRLLMEVLEHPSFPKSVSAEEVNVYVLLAQARNHLLAHPNVLEDALAALRKAKKPLPADVEQAVRSMKVGRWVYLRDTAHYSVLLPIELAAQPYAYAVKSLTTRLRDMGHGSGCAISTALMEYAGAITTDGLVGHIAYLGANYRESYGDLVAQARVQGRFYKQHLQH